jgi:hypothetical protein
VTYQSCVWVKGGNNHHQLKMAITFLIIEIFGCFNKENEALSKEVLIIAVV